jgi:hypothetical protein
MDARESLAMRTARGLIAAGHALDAVLGSGLIPADLIGSIGEAIRQEEGYELVPVDALVAEAGRPQWLRDCDRSKWLYWPQLREFLLNVKGRSLPEVRALDDASDEVVGRLPNPKDATSDVRGLVLGFVQSGKTANYTAVIAKAADAGYRLVVVLAGIDNGLRKQTNSRLKRELVGRADGKSQAVPLPPMGKRWHEFTRDEINGDFQQGYANHAALQGSQPVLLVVKKNRVVLERLIGWLREAPADVRNQLPFLLVDDEADLASIDTRGTFQTEDDGPDEEYEPPSTINRLIRELLTLFGRRAYLAYTATPFANVLIPHDTHDPDVGSDLYPKDFIIALPKPDGYFGAEELFGRFDPANGGQSGGRDVIRPVSDEDGDSLERGEMPESLTVAILDFVLAGACVGQRGGGNGPATMLVHTSQRVVDHGQITDVVSEHFRELRDEWRYQKQHGLRDRLAERWEQDFRPVTRATDLGRDIPFEELEPFISPFVESVEVREVNSAAGEVLDYEREPGLKAIAVGGNKLSRGLTLEGLLVSYFIRRSPTYDTLMQMGRWFGYRGGQDDLVRIHTTPELQNWFTDLAFVEHQLREDIRIYQDLGLTPREAGMRIREHPVMQVTAQLKRRFSSNTTISQSYALSIVQTFKFPLSRPDDLALQAEVNLQAVRGLIRSLAGSPVLGDAPSKAYWTGVPASTVLEFLRQYRVDEAGGGVSTALVVRYIERCMEAGELVRWTVALSGRQTLDRKLGTVDWGAPGGQVNQISRSRLGLADSVGVITNPGDEEIGLDEGQVEELDRRDEAERDKRRSRSVIARQLRSPLNGLLVLYPISRKSGHELANGEREARRPLYDDPADPRSRDLVGFAISFPRTEQRQAVEAYTTGTVEWRPAE